MWPKSNILLFQKKTLKFTHFVMKSNITYLKSPRFSFAALFWFFAFASGVSGVIANVVFGDVVVGLLVLSESNVLLA